MGRVIFANYTEKLDENILQFMHNLLIAWQKLETYQPKRKGRFND